MCPQKKQKAPSIDASLVNLPTTWVQPSKSAGKRKADSISDNKAEINVKHTVTDIEKALEEEMYIRLTKKITICLTDNGSLSDLKKEHLIPKRIERGTVSDTEIKAGFKSNTIAN